MQRILLQFDTDTHPSTFDRIVATDAGADRIFAYGGVSERDVTPLVHGAMFTRKPDLLQSTAIFVGGSNVDAAEKLYDTVRQTLFPPLTVSVMVDANGSNTTAAAVVTTLLKHTSLEGAEVAVLAGTGPVGRRIIRLLGDAGARIRLAGLDADLTGTIAQEARAENPSLIIKTFSTTPDGIAAACRSATCAVSAGAARAQITSLQILADAGVRLAIDLNAVAPLGIDGIATTDKARDHEGVLCYGALGVGSRKMKIHAACLSALFTNNTQTLGTREIFKLARTID